MKLGRLLINGVSFDSNQSYQASDITLPVYQVKDTLDSGYEDISSIINWNAINNQTGRDYKFIRNEIKILVFTIGSANLSTWNDLSSSEKAIAAKYFLVPKSFRDEIYTTDQQVSLGRLFSKNSIDSRSARVNKAISIVYNSLSTSDANVIINDISDVLFGNYITFGREGTVEGDPEGLFDYLYARTGTSYEITGLAAKGFTPTTGVTLTQLVDSIMDVLKNGNY